MSFDNDLKQAFERHSGDVSPTPGAWTGVDRRIRRSHRIRTALATAGGAAAIVAAAIVVPKIVSNPSRIENPIESPSPTPAPVTDETAVFRNERDGYWLQYPKDWRFGEFEAQIAFQPPGVPSIVEGGSTFAVELWVDQGDYDNPDRLGTYEGGTADVLDTTVAGRPAKVRQHDQRDGSKIARSVTYTVDWTGVYCPPGAPCPVPGPSVLIVHIQATPSEEPLWDRYSEAGLAMVDSIRLNNASSLPSNTAVATRRGSVGANVEYDDTTAAVVKFMEARIEGGGAEPWLSSNAKQQYDMRENDLSLYSPDERTSYLSYKLVARDQADANSWEFIVEISTVTTSASGGPETRATFRETLGVGPSGGVQAMIRFAVRAESVVTPAQS